MTSLNLVTPDFRQQRAASPQSQRFSLPISPHAASVFNPSLLNPSHIQTLTQTQLAQNQIQNQQPIPHPFITQHPSPLRVPQQVNTFSNAAHPHFSDPNQPSFYAGHNSQPSNPTPSNLLVSTQSGQITQDAMYQNQPLERHRPQQRQHHQHPPFLEQRQQHTLVRPQSQQPPLSQHLGHVVQQHEAYPDPSLLTDSYSHVSTQQLPPCGQAPSNSSRQHEQLSYYETSQSNNFPAQSHVVHHSQHLNNGVVAVEHPPHAFENLSLPESSSSQFSAIPGPSNLFPAASTTPLNNVRKPSQMSFPDVTLNPIDETPLPPNSFFPTTGFPPADVHTLQPPLHQQQIVIHQPFQQSIPSIRSLADPNVHRSAHIQHHTTFVPLTPAEHVYPIGQPTTLPTQLPQPIYPPHAAPGPQESHYIMQTMLGNPSVIQTHGNTVPNHIAHSPPTYQTSLQQKPDVVVVNVFQQPVDPSVAQQAVPGPSVQLPSVVQQHQMGTLPSMSMAEMVNPGTVPPSSEMMDSFLAVGRACRAIGRYDLAADAFRACMSVCPDSAEAAMSYQSSCRWNGIDASRPNLVRTVDMVHVFAEDVFNDIGNALRSVGRPNEAEMAYRAALNLSPRHAQVWNNLGNAMRAQGAIVDAMSCYSTSLSYQPGFAAAHCNLAGLLRDQGKPQEADAQYRAALMTDPNLAEAAAGLGTALRDMGRTDEAVTFYIRAVTLQPDAADHHANLANTYKDLNRIEESIVSYQAALSLQPDMPDAFCNMVHSLCVICDWSNRSQNFVTLLGIIDKQLDTLLRHPGTTSRLYSTLVGALSNSTPQLVDVSGGSRSDRDNASVSTSAGKEENSVDVLQRRRYVPHPSSPTVVKKSKKTSKFSKFMTNSSAVVAPVLSSGLPSIQPFHALIYPMRPEKFKALSAAYASRAESMVAGLPMMTQRWVAPRGPRARIKVGYVSSDYNNHPYSHLTQSIYGLHGSGTSVECYCYALTPSDQSAWRLRIERESEHFRDISGMSAKQSAEVIANDGIHVLVNCNGYTKGARTELFALRPAPVQVSFMGFPGTLGAHYIEYFITDVVTSPPELSSRMHSESLLYHPHSYFVNDHRQTSIPGPRAHPSGPLTRAHYNIPENCFLFIMHNQLYKLSPDTFDVWARILKRVPNSKIWLLRFPPSGEQRIRQEALSRGLGPDRLIFTDVAGKEEHVARAGLGDLFLDTPTCNAHTTGTDALWSGCPMITCPGPLFASRVAASLLTAAGVPELIAQDMNAYEDLAVELATDRSKLDQIRAKIESSRFSNALFDTERWVRNVEDLYWRAWKNYEEGNKPRHIFGQDVYERSGMVSRCVSRGAVSNQANGSAALDNHTNISNGGNSNGHGGTESWHSDSPFSGRMLNSTVMT